MGASEAGGVLREGKGSGNLAFRNGLERRSAWDARGARSRVASHDHPLSWSAGWQPADRPASCRRSDRSLQFEVLKRRTRTPRPTRIRITGTIRLRPPGCGADGAAVVAVSVGAGSGETVGSVTAGLVVAVVHVTAGSVVDTGALAVGGPGG